MVCAQAIDIVVAPGVTAGSRDQIARRSDPIDAEGIITSPEVHEELIDDQADRRQVQVHLGKGRRGGDCARNPGSGWFQEPELCR
jgi:hypothetical protein